MNSASGALADRIVRPKSAAGLRNMWRKGMTRTLMIRFLPVSIVGLLICYSVTCYAQNPTSSQDDEEAIKKVLAGTTEAFNKHDAKAFARFYTPDAELNHVYSGSAIPIRR